jgi:hypothetical protein
MVGVLLAYNLEHVHGQLGQMWNATETPGMIGRAPNFGKRFGVSLNRQAGSNHFLFSVIYFSQVPDMEKKYHSGAS